MTIRTATAQDARAIADLAIAFRNHLQRAVPTQAQFEASVATLLASPDARFFLAERDGRPVGYVLQRYRYSMWASGMEATIEDLYVDPAARQGGLGRALIECAVAAAEALPCTTVCLDTNEFNASSTAIYRRLGFDAFSKRWNGRQLFYRLALPRNPEAP